MYLIAHEMRICFSRNDFRWKIIFWKIFQYAVGSEPIIQLFAPNFSDELVRKDPVSLGSVEIGCDRFFFSRGRIPRQLIPGTGDRFLLARLIFVLVKNSPMRVIPQRNFDLAVGYPHWDFRVLIMKICLVTVSLFTVEAAWEIESPSINCIGFFKRCPSGGRL